MKEHYDVIIVGTGAAGLYCALTSGENENPAYHQAGGRPVRFIPGTGRNLYAARRR